MSNCNYVVFTDITAFYDNIHIPTLIKELLNCGVSKELSREVNKLLNHWSEPVGQGIPQNNSASDLLAKIYLNEVDLALNKAGYIHHRYVDDIKIFCGSKTEAKEVLILLARLLRNRGLSLQGAKTKILHAKEAFIETIGSQSVIGTINEEINDDYLLYEPAYIGTDEEVKIPDSIPVEIIRQTFKANFIDAPDNFDKTLFHFLINRLIKIKDSFALDYCLASLEKQPEETAFFLKYSDSFNQYEEVKLKNEMKNSLLKFLLSNKAVYAFQNYQILIWLCENGFICKDFYTLINKRINSENWKYDIAQEVKKTVK